MAGFEVTPEALTDSPAGLAAWILERVRAWSDCDGDLESRFSLDELLANVTLYWVTGTAASSIRLYRESQLTPLQLGPGDRIRVPMGFARFPGGGSFPAAAMGRAGVRRAAVDRDAPGKPLRGMGGAAASRRGRPQVLPPSPLKRRQLRREVDAIAPSLQASPSSSGCQAPREGFR